MWMCMCHSHIHIYIYTYTYLHSRVQYIYTYTCRCICISVCTSWWHIYIYIHIHTYLYIHSQMHMDIHILLHIYHIYFHAYTYACKCQNSETLFFTGFVFFEETSSFLGTWLRPTSQRRWNKLHGHPDLSQPSRFGSRLWKRRGWRRVLYWGGDCWLDRNTGPDWQRGELKWQLVFDRDVSTLQPYNGKIVDKVWAKKSWSLNDAFE